MRAVLILIGVVFLLAGCGGRDEVGEPAAALREWIGQSDRALVMKWGAPDAVYTTKDGNRILTWRRSRTERQGGEVYTVTETRVVDGEKVVVPITRQAPVINWRYECVTSFELNRYGYIVGNTAEGNDCTAPPQPD